MNNWCVGQTDYVSNMQVLLAERKSLQSFEIDCLFVTFTVKKIMVGSGIGKNRPSLAFYEIFGFQR